jgi:hypothetical protein
MLAKGEGKLWFAFVVGLLILFILETTFVALLRWLQRRQEQKHRGFPIEPRGTDDEQPPH